MPDPDLETGLDEATAEEAEVDDSVEGGDGQDEAEG